MTSFDVSGPGWLAAANLINSSRVIVRKKSKLDVIWIMSKCAGGMYDIRMVMQRNTTAMDFESSA